MMQATPERRPVILAGLPTESIDNARSVVESLSRVFGVTPEAHEVLELYDEDAAPVVVLWLGKNPTSSFHTASELNHRHATTIIVGPDKNADVILRAMRAGATEFVVQNDDDDLRRALRKLVVKETDTARGSVVTVFAAKGGVGATAIATNLAGALQRSGDRVCLVDLDLHFGDVLSFLDLAGSYSIVDVMANIQRLDRDLLDSSVTRHSSGVFVLAQSDKIEEAENIRVQDVDTLLTFLRQHYDRVVVDGLRGFGDIALAALDASDKVLLVLTQDIPSVRNAQRCLDLFRELGYNENKVHLLINRYQRGSDLDVDVVEEATTWAVSATVANDYRALNRSVNRGVMLFDEAPRSKLTRDVDGLVPLGRAQRLQRRRMTGPLGGIFTRK
ncbi:CpaE family protein [Myxococcota bacterium]